MKIEPNSDVTAPVQIAVCLKNKSLATFVRRSLCTPLSNVIMQISVIGSFPKPIMVFGVSLCALSGLLISRNGNKLETGPEISKFVWRCCDI